jgi:hypothetical protein
MLCYVKAAPQLVATSLLADPICFLLYQRDVVCNFLYRSPKPLQHLFTRKKGAHHVGYWFRLMLHYVLRQDPTVQSCFRREFWWTRHWLPPHALPSRALVVLSGRDAIAPAHEVHAYLQRCTPTNGGGARANGRAIGGCADGGAAACSGGDEPRVEVEMHERWHHGWLMLHARARARLIGRLQQLMDAAEAEGKGRPSATSTRRSTSPGRG